MPINNDKKKFITNFVFPKNKENSQKSEMSKPQSAPYIYIYKITNQRKSLTQHRGWCWV